MEKVKFKGSALENVILTELNKCNILMNNDKKYVSGVTSEEIINDNIPYISEWLALDGGLEELSNYEYELNDFYVRALSRYNAYSRLTDECVLCNKDIKVIDKLSEICDDLSVIIDSVRYSKEDKEF